MVHGSCSKGPCSKSVVEARDFRIEGVAFSVKGAWLKVQSFGFRVQGAEFNGVEGFQFRVW